MSLKPGIGKDALHEVASTLMTYDLEQKYVDVPAALMHGKRKMPLGRYLRQNLRALVGKEKEAPIETLKAVEEAMRPVREAARASKENPSFKGQILAANRQKNTNLKARLKIHERKKKL